MKVARLFLIDWHDSGQQPIARLAPTRQSDDALITESQAWIAEYAFEPAPVAAMVLRCGLAERTFSRRFRHATGMTPLEYVHTLRLEEARHWLETTEDPVEAVALAVGDEDAAFFGRLLRRKVNLNPAQYHCRFRGLRRALNRTGRRMNGTLTNKSRVLVGGSGCPQKNCCSLLLKMDRSHGSI